MRYSHLNHIKTAITLVGSKFLPDLGIIMEFSCSLEQVRYGIGKCLRHPGAGNLPSGTPVGSVKGNEFTLHFKKPSRNFWRPEFKGGISATDNHVKVVVWCGFSGEAGAATALLWTLFAAAFTISLGKFISGDMNVYDFIKVCSVVFCGFAFPCIAFWKEFRDDKIQMQSILDGVEK